MVLLKLDESCTAFQIFSSSIRSNKTLTTYREGLNHFMRFHGIKDYMDLKNADTDTIQDWLERWVVDQKNKGLMHFTIAGRLHGVELFLDMNKKIWYKRIVRKLMPSNDQIPGGEVPFTTEELYQMLLACKKPRDAALMHFIASTGIRPLAFEDPVLRMKHLEKIDDCYAIKVYDGSKEGYHVFLTPEAGKALDTYIKSRKLNGEQITDESPIFVNYPNERLVKHDYLSAFTIRGILEKLFKTAGIERKKQGRRYDKSIVYGFRKRFNGILKMNNLVNPNIAEKLMAHKRGLDSSYLKPTREQCFAEFKKAIPELTVDGSERLSIKNKILEDEKFKLEKENSEFEIKNQYVKDLVNLLEANPTLVEQMKNFEKFFDEKIATRLSNWLGSSELSSSLQPDVSKIRLGI